MNDHAATAEPPARVPRARAVEQDLAPATLGDPRLWTATSYCMPVKRRIKLLGVTDEQARRDRLRCFERVERARPP